MNNTKLTFKNVISKLNEIGMTEVVIEQEMIKKIKTNFSNDAIVILHQDTAHEFIVFPEQDFSIKEVKQTPISKYFDDAKDVSPLQAFTMQRVFKTFAPELRGSYSEKVEHIKGKLMSWYVDFCNKNNTYVAMVYFKNKNQVLIGEIKIKSESEGKPELTKITDIDIVKPYYQRKDGEDYRVFA